MPETTKTCPKCRTEIDRRASVCPQCHSKIGSSWVPGCLIVVVALFILLSVFSSAMESSKNETPVAPSVPAPERVVSDELELLSKMDDREYTFITVSGEVKNISGASIKNVTSVVSYYTASGELVKTADALIEYNPVLAGQTSPFKVMTTDNPAITKYSVSFKYLMGGTIRTKDSTK